MHGFSEARIAALWYRWHTVVRRGPIGPVTLFEPWTHWIPPDLHGFYKWAMDTLALLNEFFFEGCASSPDFSFAGLVQLDPGRSFLSSISVASA